MRRRGHQVAIPMIALLAVSCASSSELARRSEVALRSHEYSRAYREARASLEKDASNARALMAISTAASHLVDEQEQRVLNLAAVDTLEAADEAIMLVEFRAEAIRWGATLPLHSEFAEKSNLIRRGAAGQLYHAALANSKQGRPKQSYLQLMSVRRYEAGFRDIDTRIPNTYQQAVTRVAVLPFENEAGVPGLSRDISDLMYEKLSSRIDPKHFQFTQLVPADKVYDQLTVSRLGLLTREEAIALGRKVGARRVVWGRFHGMRTDSHTDRYRSSIWRRYVERDTSGQNVERFVEVPFEAVERWRDVNLTMDFELIDTDDERTVVERRRDLDAAAHTVYTDYLPEGDCNAYLLVPPTMKANDAARATHAQEEWKGTFKNWSVPKLLERARRDHSRRRYKSDFRDEFIRGSNDYPIFLDDLPSANDMARIALDDSWKGVLEALSEADEKD